MVNRYFEKRIPQVYSKSFSKKYQTLIFNVCLCKAMLYFHLKSRDVILDSVPVSGICPSKLFLVYGLSTKGFRQVYVYAAICCRTILTMYHRYMVQCVKRPNFELYVTMVKQGEFLIFSRTHLFETQTFYNSIFTVCSHHATNLFPYD